jgi:hypothetical protein
MRSSFSRRPSPATAIAFVALLAALSGTAVALPGRNTVDSGDIRNGAVKRSDIAANATNGNKVANGSLTGADVRNDGLTGTDVNEGSLAQVPSASSADRANTATTADRATTAGNADLLDGQDSSDLASIDNPGIALAGANISATGTVNSWFNNFGGAPTVSHTPASGVYVITFPGLEGDLISSQVIHQATLIGTLGGEIDVLSLGGNPHISTHSSAGAPADHGFAYVVFATNAAP